MNVPLCYSGFGSYQFASQTVVWPFGLSRASKAKIASKMKMPYDGKTRPRLAWVGLFRPAFVGEQLSF
ncbi:MAG: hypothetical protein ACRER2_13105 [Methylococcales bacterium]